MSEYESPEIVHWRDLLGNPYLMSIEPEMLDEEGYIKTINCRVRGDSKSSLGVKERWVQFDKEYVFEKLKRTFKNFTPIQTIQALGVFKEEIIGND